MNRFSFEDAPSDYSDVALLAVCDGVGGLDSGEVASATVVNWLTEWFDEDLPRLIRLHRGDCNSLFDAAEQEWRLYLSMLNGALSTLGARKGSRMGTTFTASLLVHGEVLVGHVGDTRAYRFREGDMEILTQDQTWVAREVQRGNIPPEKARFHPKRNIILQSVGTQTELQPVFTRSEYREGDVFMVCCDGFRNELFDDELLDGFGRLGNAGDSDVSDVCKRLVDLVQERGERDNVTVVAATYSGGVEYGSPVIRMPEGFTTPKAGD